MEDERKDREQLLGELEKLRRQIAALQADPNDGVTGDRLPAGIERHRPANEEYLREMANHIHEAFWVLDWPQRKAVYVNPAYENIWGRPIQDIYDDGDRWYDSIHPEDRESARASLAKMVESEGVQRREYRVVRPDGAIRWVSDRVYAVRDANGAVSRVIGVAEDITERKHSEEVVRTGEARLRAAVESLPFDFFMLSTDGRYVMQNSVCKRHWGDSVGKCIEDLHLDEDTLTLWQTNNRRALAGEVVEGEVELTPRGERGYYHNIVSPIRDGDVIRGILGVNIDITARKQAEEALREINDELEERVKQRTAQLEAANARLEEEVTYSKQVETELRKSEEKYRTLVESAGETIAVVDEKGVFLFMNKTAALRLGGRPEDLTGKSMWDLFPKAIADRQAESVRNTIQTGEGANSIVLVELAGQHRWYSTTVAPIRDADGKPNSALVIARDIHDLKQVQEQLEQYQQHMSRAEHLASVGTLSATVAHELTQPLTVVRLSIQSALAQLKEADCPPATWEALHDSLDGLEDVVSRVERFRNYARQSTKADPRHVRLQDIVGRTFRLLEDKARAGGVSLETEGLDALPLAYADPKDLEQMCFALIENAVQAAGGQKGRRLTIRGQVKDQQIILDFEDTCGGIPAEDQAKIFEPFFTTKALGEGTGLGLCIVETTVSRLGGKVHVETKAGEGSTFRITLPLEEP